MSSIRQHQKKGLDPHVTTCKQCGEAVGIALPGADNKVYKCSSCNATLIGRPQRTGTNQCCSNPVIGLVRELHEFEELPVELCDKCCEKHAQMHEQMSEVVREGGILWRCTNCGSEGGIRLTEDTKEFVAEVRTRAEVPEGPVGIEFDNNDRCPVCREEEGENEVSTAP